MKRKKTSKGILVDVALLLLCLMCITACISSGILAKYTQRTAGADSTRIAKFDFDITPPQNSDLRLDENNKVDYTFCVKNNSEVAASCSIILKFDLTSCTGITAKIGEKAGDQDGNEITISDFAVLAPNETVSKTITIEVDPVLYDKPIDFDVVIRLTQAD